MGAAGGPAWLQTESRRVFTIMHWPTWGNSTKGLGKLPTNGCRTIFNLTITVHHAAGRALSSLNVSGPLLLAFPAIIL